MAISCNSEEPQSLVQTNDEVTLAFTAGIAKADVEVSRSAVSGSIFPAGSYELGTWVCLHEEENFSPAQSDFNHIHTILTSTGTESSMEFLFRDRPRSSLNVTRRTPLDIYSYYPHVYGSEYYDLKPDRVPFTVSTDEKDWMWAKKTLSKDDLTGDTVPVQLQFSHAMTCIRLIIKAKYSGSTVTSIKLSDSKNRIYTAGWLDLASQTVILDESSKASSLNLNFGRGISNSDVSFYFILPEIKPVGENELTLSFVISGTSISEEFSIPAISYTIGDTTITGFEQGYCYTYRIYVDNDLTFAPVEIDSEWGTQEYTYRI